MRRDYDGYVELARRNLTQLIKLVEDPTLPLFERSVALEALGYTDNADRCLPILFRYVEHESATLREGAVHGLGGFLSSPGLTDWLEKIAATDPDEDVCEAARQVL
jgi:HEAT repeat protein